MLQFTYKEVAQHSKVVELDFADYSLQLLARKIKSYFPEAFPLSYLQWSSRFYFEGSS